MASAGCGGAASPALTVKETIQTAKKNNNGRYTYKDFIIIRHLKLSAANITINPNKNKNLLTNL